MSSVNDWSHRGLKKATWLMVRGESDIKIELVFNVLCRQLIIRVGGEIRVNIEEKKLNDPELFPVTFVTEVSGCFLKLKVSVDIEQKTFDIEVDTVKFDELPKVEP